VVTNAFATEMDLFPTLVKLAGLKMPADRTYDGQDLEQELFHNGPGREPLFFYYRNSPGGPYDREEQLQAVRKGRWKLHVAVSYRRQPPYPGEGEPPLLYDVQEDVSERRNVAKRQPQVVKELLELIKQHQASFVPAPTQL
jgi:arylsulfatase A-like enzyme